jgi:UPF0042 nucleotide-binding protein
VRLIIVSGLSGSGKSVALNALEDLGFYCVDNIPASLLGVFVEDLLKRRDTAYENVAVGLDARNRPADIDTVPRIAAELVPKGIGCEIIFLQAEDDILLSRFSETRRKHPLSSAGVSLRDAIARERQLLGSVINSADLIIDTTRTTVYELRDWMSSRVARREATALSILIESFGYKHGLPADADFVFDVRCLPNPYWEPRLRNLNGRDSAVIEFLGQHDEVTAMLDDIEQFLDRWIPRYRSYERSYLTVAIGCTGGQHRSVFFAEQLAQRLESRYGDIATRHTELR